MGQKRGLRKARRQFEKPQWEVQPYLLLRSLCFPTDYGLANFPHWKWVESRSWIQIATQLDLLLHHLYSLSKIRLLLRSVLTGPNYCFAGILQKNKKQKKHQPPPQKKQKQKNQQLLWPKNGWVVEMLVLEALRSKVPCHQAWITEVSFGSRLISSDAKRRRCPYEKCLLLTEELFAYYMLHSFYGMRRMKSNPEQWFCREGLLLKGK